MIAVAGDIEHREAVDLAAAAFGTGNGAIPGFAAAPALPAGERALLRARRDTTQAQLIVGVPALRRDHPDAWILAVLNAVLGDGMSSRLFLSVREAQGLAYDVSSGLVDYADAGSLEVSAGVDPGAPARPRSMPSWSSSARLRDEPVPADELAKTKAYLSGGLELRMDETRHLASWIGGQEALHDRVLDARRGPGRGRRGRCRRGPAPGAASCSATTGSGSRSSRRPATCAASSAA